MAKTYGSWENVPDEVCKRDMGWLDDFDLPVRAINCLRYWTDFRSPEDVRESSDIELLRIPNCGRTTVRAIRDAFRERKGESKEDIIAALRRIQTEISRVIYMVEAL